MDDTKRFFILFLLIFTILVIWQYLFLPKAPPVEKKSQMEELIIGSESLKISKTESITQNAVRQKKAQVKEEKIVLANEKVKLTFSNLGGVLTSVFLKNYGCELLPENGRYFGLEILDGGKRLNLDDSVFSFFRSDSKIVFQLKIDNKILQKEYSLKKDFLFSFNLAFPKSNLVMMVSFPYGLAYTERDTVDDFNHYRARVEQINKSKVFEVKKIKEERIERGPFNWLSQGGKYFIFVLKPNIEVDSVMLLSHQTRGGFKLFTANNQIDFDFIFAPLEYNLLKSFRIGLEKTVPLGWPRPFSLAMLWFLKLLYSIFRNYGVAIILFALLVKSLFHPLTRLQLLQLKKMQLLQPKLEEIRRKYKENPALLNRETMQLYRLHKVNPFSGCLPLLIQLPVFWALYSVFRSTVELRSAHFLFWIKDLSIKDPFYILPILMGASFLAQNLLTTMDKKNIAFTIIFPIFSTVIFLNFPSGLQLYWFTFNILSILESLVIQKGGFKWTRNKKIPTLQKIKTIQERQDPMTK